SPPRLTTRKTRATQRSRRYPWPGLPGSSPVFVFSCGLPCRMPIGLEGYSGEPERPPNDVRNRSLSGPKLPLTSGHAGELDPEGGARTHLAREADIAAHLLDELARDVQAEAHAALVPRLARIGLRALAEDPRAEIFRNALATVAYFHPHPFTAQLGIDFDGAARRGEFRRVGQQVGEHLRVSFVVEVDHHPGID